MRLLLIGAPGAGKGTQAIRLAQHFGITHISSGDLLRKHIADQTSLGTSIRGYVERGDLVPDQIVMDMLRKPVVAANQNGGYVLDGFPRTVQQAEAAYFAAKDLGVAVQVAAHLEVDHDELVRRLLSRGRGSEDTREVIDHRLRVYEEQTRTMIDYYAEREKLVVVNGARPMDEVTWSLEVQLQRVQRLLRD
jgi:adenylate kinase